MSKTYDAARSFLDQAVDGLVEAGQVIPGGPGEQTGAAASRGGMKTAVRHVGLRDKNTRSVTVVGCPQGSP